jgi:WD40 repeat protein
VPRVSGAQASLTIARTWPLGDWVRALSWSGDGTRVAAACADGAVVVAPAHGATGADSDASVVHEHPGGALAVAYSAGGTLASGGEDGRLVVDGRVWEEGAGWVEHVAWRGDGGLLAATRRRQVSLWSPAGVCTGAPPALPATVACIDWHPRGVVLAAGSYGGVRLLRGGDAREADRLEWTGSVLALAFSPDGVRLAHGNQDASVHFWELRRKRELEMTGYPFKVRELAWSGDGRWLATGGSDVVTVWDFAGRGPRGSRPRELERHEERLVALAFQPSGRLLASTAADGLVCLWDVAHDDLPLASAALEAAATCLRWSPDGRRLAVGTTDGTLAVLAVEQ